MEESFYGAIEAGGTKWLCGVGPSHHQLTVTSIPTTTPDETLEKVVEFFWPYRDKLKAVGIACFGPIDLDRTSPTYGFIKSTPKPGWSGTDVVGRLKSRLGISYIAWETDVTAAALAEGQYGVCQGLHSYVYFTIGTGVGGGAIVNGRPVHGFMHPEMGHCLVRTGSYESNSGGHCPFHGDSCVEGLVSGPALEAVTGMKGRDIPEDSPIWGQVANVVATLCLNAVFFLSPQRIVLGGGVGSRPELLRLVRRAFRDISGDYAVIPGSIEEFIRQPGCQTFSSGLMGAFLLGKELHQEQL